jgi:hypothetical protein
MTFQIGDRVKSQAGIICTVHGVRDPSGPCWPYNAINISANPELPFWESIDRFELYAKAGEFVVGDKIIATATAEGAFTKGRMYDVVGTQYGRPSVAKDDSGVPNGWSSQNFRLATSDEIMVADLKVPAFTKGKPSIEWIKPLTSTADVEGLAKMFHSEPDLMRKEIPAADFDFSTIKAGDRVIAELIVKRDGVDLDGDVVVERGGNDHVAFIETQYITSVVPAPKPKTLRERAIEAAGEAWTATIGGQNVVESIVDAVLAEAGKA